MADFNKALPFILNNEGGFTNDPNDSGGATNYGLTITDLIDSGYVNPDIETIRDLRMPQVQNIYRILYWDKLQLDAVLSQKIATLVFDQGVNRGIRTITRDIQRLGLLRPDGIMGPKTLNYINQTVESSLCKNLIEVAKQSYRAIASNNPKDKVFLNGWLNRCDALTAMVQA